MLFLVITLFAFALAILGTWEVFHLFFAIPVSLMSVVGSLVVPIIIFFLLRILVNRLTKSSAQRPNELGEGKNRDYCLLVFASLTGLVGMALVFIQALVDFEVIKHAPDFSFSSEELLLGFSGLCMLIEEFKLLESETHARGRINKLLNRMEKKDKEVREKHNEITKQIEKVGPKIVRTVREIFEGKNKEDEPAGGA